MDVSQRIANILNYYKTNPGCDPNLFEYIGLCEDMSSYLNEKAPNYGIYSTVRLTPEEETVRILSGGSCLQHAGPTKELEEDSYSRHSYFKNVEHFYDVTPKLVFLEIQRIINRLSAPSLSKLKQYTKEDAAKKYPEATHTFEQFVLLTGEVSQKLLNNDLEITEESSLYKLFLESYRAATQYSRLGDYSLRQKLGAVSLFIAQKKRDVAKGFISEFSYDNAYEMEEIQRLNQELCDPQSGGYYTSPVGETDINKMTYVKSEPSPRQLLLEETMNEFQKGSKTR